MKLRKLAASMVFLFGASVANANELTEIGEPIPIYTEAELIKLINENKHLEQVKSDSCQLVEDIVARATRISLPSYEFLYGDMLAWGVCVEQDVELGLYYMENAAHQGLPAALAGRCCFIFPLLGYIPHLCLARNLAFVFVHFTP